jgi:hypothetical protein
LKEDVEAHQSIDSGDSFPIDSSVAAAARDLDLSESSFTKHPLNQTLESCWSQLVGENAVKALPPVEFRRAILGSCDFWGFRLFRVPGSLWKLPGRTSLHRADLPYPAVWPMLLMGMVCCDTPSLRA